MSTDSLVFPWIIKGELNQDALRATLGYIVQRHESLRTTYGREGGAWRQIIWPARVELPLVQLPTGTTNLSNALADFMSIIAEEPLDLTASPLWRACLAQIDKTTHLLLCAGHHSLTDVASQEIISGEIARAYPSYAAGRAPALAPLATQLRDFAEWERRPMAPEAITHWRALHPQMTASLALPQTRQVQRLRFTAHAWPLITRAQVAALTEIAASVGASLGTAIRTLCAATLAPYAENAVPLGVVHTNRRNPDHRFLIGEIADQLPVPLDISGGPSFPDLIHRAHRAWTAARIFSNSPGTIRRGLRLCHDVPLFEAAVNYFPESAPLTELDLSTPDASVVTLSPLPFVDARSPELDRTYDGAPPLGFGFSRIGRGIKVELWAPENYYQPDVLAGLAQSFTVVLSTAVLKANTPIRRRVPSDPA
jgi:hypothetical protein